MGAGRLLIALGLVGIGCKEKEEQPTETGTDPAGACGALGSLTLTVAGWVRDRGGSRVPEVDLTLEERNWDPGTVHATARSDANGDFTLSASGMPVVEDCWGTAVQYWLVGESGGLWGEKPMNALFSEAYETGATSVELDFPLLVE